MKRRIIQLVLIAAVSCCIFCNSSIEISASESACYLPEDQIEYCKLMQERYNVSAALLAAIIQAESSGDPTASNGKCLGLMQVNWDLWASCDDDPNDVYSQIELGTWVLLQYFEEYGDDLYQVLGHYHGERSVDSNNPSYYVRTICATAQEIEKQWYGR